MNSPYRFFALSFLLTACSQPPFNAPPTAAPVTAVLPTESPADSASDAASESLSLMEKLEQDLLEQLSGTQQPTISAGQATIAVLADAALTPAEQCRLYPPAAALLYATFTRDEATTVDFLPRQQLLLDLANLSSRGALACYQPAEPCNSYGLSGCVTLEKPAVKKAFVIYYLALQQLDQLTSLATSQFLEEELAQAAKLLNLAEFDYKSHSATLFAQFCHFPENPLTNALCERINHD